MKDKFDIEERFNAEYRKGTHWEKKEDKRAVDFATLLNDRSTILDAGCGSGRDAIYFTSLGHDVYGIDLSPVAIEKAKIKNHNIKYRVGSLELLPYPDEKFHAFYCGYVLSATQIYKAIEELARVTKKGGIACIILLHYTEYPYNSFFTHILDYPKALETFKQYFTITDLEEDEYWEEDQHGDHKHKRAAIRLKK